MNKVAEAPMFGENDTPGVGNQISNITAELSPSNKLPSTKVSRVATNADWTNGLISAPLCVQHSAFPPVMEIPRQRGGSDPPSCSRDSSLSAALLLFLPSLSSSPESNFTGTSKVAHSHPPKSQ